jgi:DsbC/DsbD-like thiol-disulfide interchange protein
MNSHKPSDAYLIPTTLTPQLPPGIQLDEMVYPEGRSEKFSFSPDKPLNVYTSSVTLRLRLSANANAALGATSLPFILRYQACNDAACLPPVKVPVAVSLQIAQAGTKTRAVHPEVFSPSSSSK